ncbi:MAG TPA: sigma 54-interacting transcriptional regulator [Candidatus Competibacteraceae bacterium]|nr:sigma 54-interacting transcriptional regulator [Candidatus Competibacteraceae bacterium]
MPYLDELEPGLRALVEGTAAVTGEDFFRALVKGVATALGVRYAFISEFAEVRTRVRILAFWGDGGYGENIEYDLAGTPCEAVLAGEAKHYPQGVCQLFPAEEALREMGAESYLAIPLVDGAGEVLGHLAVIDDKPMPAAPRELALFQVFAARAAAELQRIQVERALRESESRLGAILDSAMDAVICIDDEHRVTFFNPAAQKSFRCAASWALGQSFERFLSRPLRAVLDHYLGAVEGAAEAHSLWAPQGLSALRADGEEFPIEVTLSSSRVAGRRLYTLILRDANERRQAEEALARLSLENAYLQEQLNGGVREIVGGSAALRSVQEQLRKVARADTTVLLQGETGTGKELLARFVHQLSPRRERLLVKMNCAALPTELIESELFGHEKGAFTGAIASRKGRFELADGGTLFLDEVGELSLPAQAKLLRVLQEQEFERVGGTRSIRVDVRVVAATNRDLTRMVEEGGFRADLYYRLNVFPVRVPPLRERREDIPPLIEHFLAGLRRRLGKSLRGVSPQAMERMLAYPWPGNIRELANVIERAAILASGLLIEVDDLGLAPLKPAGSIPAMPVPEVADLSLEEVERRHIQRVLEACGGVIEGPRGAAAILNLNPRPCARA